MAYGSGGELWFVNTRFSCLATLDSEASFTPRWRPPFVTELEPSDRCHLNGLGMVDGHRDDHRFRHQLQPGQLDGLSPWAEASSVRTASCR